MQTRRGCIFCWHTRKARNRCSPLRSEKRCETLSLNSEEDRSLSKHKNAESADALITSLREAVQIERGQKRAARRRRVYVTARDVAVDPPRDYRAPMVQAIRKRLCLSQTVFATTLNVSPATVRAWEQGVRVPDGPSRRLLEIADRHPDILLENLR